MRISPVISHAKAILCTLFQKVWCLGSFSWFFFFSSLQKSACGVTHCYSVLLLASQHALFSMSSSVSLHSQSQMRRLIQTRRRHASAVGERCTTGRWAWPPVGWNVSAGTLSFHTITPTAPRITSASKRLTSGLGRQRMSGCIFRGLSAALIRGGWFGGAARLSHPSSVVGMIMIPGTQLGSEESP